jgi:hypothetical protein
MGGASQKSLDQRVRFRVVHIGPHLAQLLPVPDPVTPPTLLTVYGQVYEVAWSGALERDGVCPPLSLEGGSSSLHPANYMSAWGQTGNGASGTRLSKGRGKKGAP